MRKPVFWAKLALTLCVVSIFGCGAEKAAEKPAGAPAAGAAGAGGAAPAAGGNPAVQQGAASTPAPAPSGPVPVAAKIDAEVQKKVAAIGAKLKEQSGKPDAEKPATTEKPASKVLPPVSPLSAVAGRQDLSYIPADAFAAMVIHPRRAYEHPVAKAVRAILPPDAMEGIAPRGGSPFGPPVGYDDVVEMAASMGIALENLDEVVFLFDKKLMEVAAAGGAGPTPELPPFGVIVRNSAPVDIDALVGKLAEAVANAQPEIPVTGPPKPAPGIEVETHEGVTLLALPKQKVAVALVTDSMILAGQTDFVKKMISARDQSAATSGLTRRLEAVGSRLYVLAIDGVAVEAPIKQMTTQLPPFVALFVPYITGAKEASLAIDLDAPELVQVTLQFKAPTLTAGLYGMLDQQFGEAKKNAPMLREMMKSEAEAAPLLPYFDQLVAETKLASTEDTITFTVPKLKDLEKLPDLLKPSIEKAKQAAEKTKKNNNLKMIGIAFHNYHDSFNTFPALNGMGTKGQPHPGLSWRVYLLPYIENANLYQEFKLDEPWDSENNKKLISKMPKIFGTNPDGKTSIHVFTGEGAPFKNDEGVAISAILDGTSNTALAVEAGEDTADIWTKPGGLTFDPKEPLKCLGTVKEFGVLFMDGSVRRFTMLDPAVFSKIVQHADGQPVEIP